MLFHTRAMSTNTNALIQTLRRRRSLPEPRVRKALRQAAGLTQEEVGAAVGVSGPTVSRWETGHRSPRGDALDSYAEVLATLAREMA